MNKGVLVYVLQRSGDMEEKVLMIYGAEPYAPHYGVYNGIGGKIAEGETPEACARRELLEEAGLEALSLDPVGKITFLGGAHGDWDVFVYRVCEYIGDPQENEREGKLRWFDTRRVSEIPTGKADQFFLPLVFQGLHFDGAFSFDGNGGFEFRCWP